MSLTIEERLEALRLENQELREMLTKVAELAYNAYHDSKMSRYSSVPDDVWAFVRREKE